MPTVPNWGRYAELRPADIEEIRAASPVAFLPVGALEWHGPHLPLGTDGMLAEAVAERAARRVGGVVLPTTWWPAAALPHPLSLEAGAAVGPLWDAMLAQVAAAGWQVAVIISGPHMPAHDLALIAAAERAIHAHGLLTLAVPPLSLVDELMIDHAALWESSLLMALRPELVALDALGEGALIPGQSGVIGRDPRHTATASLGARALILAVERIVVAANDLLRRHDPAPLLALYQERRARYRSFTERYGDDPSAATRAWWNEMLGEK